MNSNADLLGIHTTEDLVPLFENESYVADEDTITSVFLALKLERPLLIEGNPGCGKTELAKVLSRAFRTDLIRLQCYEGLDSNSTIYEWDYLRQLLEIKMEEARNNLGDLEPKIFGERFLLERPLLRAVRQKGPKPPVLLIDELDRADEEFDGFLLEFLGEFQLSIPELGTFKADPSPIVIITSNNTRELSDGLRRRCLYLNVTYPSVRKELEIVKLKVPQIEEKLSAQLVDLVNKLRASNEIRRKPGVSETLDWALSLIALGKKQLDSNTIESTIKCVVKNSDDLQLVKKSVLPTLSRAESQA